MKNLVVGLVGVTVVQLASMGCAAQSTVGQAPEVEVDEVAGLDEGSSHDGWSHTPFATADIGSGTFSWGTVFSRSYGTSTRGGGACLVGHSSNFGPTEFCSDDSSCTTTARAIWPGVSAFGYCYLGSCYYRPGSPGELCIQNSNRSPGSHPGTPGAENLFGVRTGGAGPDHALGCMTKAGGPSTACGGTNSSAYMRVVNALDSTGGPW